MQAVIDIDPQVRALARIRKLSQPILVLLTIVLVAAVLIPVAQILVILFFSDQVGSLHSFLSFNAWITGGCGGRASSRCDDDSACRLKPRAAL